MLVVKELTASQTFAKLGNVANERHEFQICPVNFTYRWEEHQSKESNVGETDALVVEALDSEPCDLSATQQVRQNHCGKSR